MFPKKRFPINIDDIDKLNQKERDCYKKKILSEDVFLVKVAWMKYYQLQPDDEPVGGMKYLQKMQYTEEGVADIIENINFKNFEDFAYYFGAFETNGRTPHLERINGDKNNRDCKSVDNVLVIFCAANPERKGKGETNIIGWYVNATVYRDWQNEEDFEYGYNICVEKKRALFPNCVLLPVPERNKKIWRLPQVSGSEINFGRSMYKFPANTVPELQKIIKEIANYNGENWCGKFSD